MKTIGKVSFFTGPHTLGAEDNLETAIVAFIDRATKTLDVAVQELESQPIAEALLAAKARRVRVRIVLEGDYLREDTPLTDPLSAGGSNETNRQLFSALLRAGIDARTDYNPKIFHQKFIVRDIDVSGSDRRAVLTGSTNFTPTGTHRNLNHVVTVASATAAREYANEFEEIWNGTFGAVRLRHDPKPREFHVSKVPVKILFAPDHAPEMEIMKQMLKARERVEFAIFTFSQSSGIDDAMIALTNGGLPVSGVFDAQQGNQTWAASRPVANAGATLHLAQRRTVNGHSETLGKLHHKLMVIDRQVIIAGSFNYTGPANALNDENIIILGDLEETDAASIAAQKELGEYAAAEIQRITAVHGVAI